MVISQGDVFWTNLPVPFGSEPGYRRPAVVIQADFLNHGAIGTVVVCGLTTSLQRALSPGNVVLHKGEANLPERSVVNVTQIVALNRSRLVSKIGTLSPERVAEILDGVCIVLGIDRFPSP